MKTTLLLTGASGFLGTQIARWLLLNTDVDISALVRAQNGGAARDRLVREWWDWPELRSAVGQRVRVLAGDVTLPALGLGAADYTGLVGSLTYIIHAAADIRLFAPLAELREANVAGTRQVLELARRVQSAHGLKRFAFVSTAYVAGKRSGLILEEDLSDRWGFSSPYERSKFEAEQLVRQAGGEFPISIFRPSMIVGDSKTGQIKSFNTLYTPLRLFLTGQLGVAPAQPALRVNLVPVDYVAGSIGRLTFDAAAEGLTFHLNPPSEDLPSLAEIANFTRAWAQEKMRIRLPRPVYLPIPGLERCAPFLGKVAGREIGQLAQLLPYFNHQPRLSCANTARLLGPYPHPWRELLAPILAYAVKRSFWALSPRTVYEQVLFRLRSKSKPIRYHDLADGQELVRPAEGLRADIQAAAAALQALGVQSGERVAIIGLNSSRYFSLLIANGLSGAVSTPIYATCPPKEIQDLLQDCRARVFLVGAPEVLEALDQIDFNGRVVSFCRQAVPAHIQRAVIGWDEFLGLGSGKKENDLRVGLDAPAVQYYTSGTTGRPKGVVFRQEQLRWLASTLSGMYPWRERNRRGAYLSYLPMNHVVEGMLANFSPYYVPAALDIYFLEEFNELPSALKTARPTIFFSVPRFFEKVRAAFLLNPLSKRYLTLPQGAPRRLLKTLLRRGLLRKTGLDRCKQIIVGSAPSSPDLLELFHELEIEVHDAYGLTEAPLVTLNRLGRNRVGTLGEALPETEIRIGPDGEVQVRGPQVAVEYTGNYDRELGGAFSDGWLNSGDLGALSPDGYLSIIGRKKDLMITSYARKIFPAPIEARLRAIPGVSEAMLIGERRPYCTALFWMEKNAWSQATARIIKEGLSEINRQLPHAEQIKRWAVLSGDLSIENGFLTGSLKVKRAVVAASLAEVIDGLYAGISTAGVLDSGELPRA